MTHTEQYLTEAQSFLDIQASLQSRQGVEPLVLLSVQRDLALVELQARQLEQLELICNKLHDEEVKK